MSQAVSRPLSEKIAWITGGGGGIGGAAAVTLAGYGATVILSGRGRDSLAAVAQRISEDGGKAEVLAGDLASPQTATELMQEIESRHGRLDILINNAGTNIPERSWARLSAPGALEVVEGNLASAFFVVIAALPIMRRQQDGIIINMASIAGRVVKTQPGPAYTAAKHGVVAMSQSINLEENCNGIRSTAICPGDVATPLVGKRPEVVSEAARARMLQPADIAELIGHVVLSPKHVCINEIVVMPTSS